MRRFLILLLMATLLGSAFRLANLKGKVYWHDEAYTAMYVTGNGDAAVLSTLFDGEVKSAADVMKTQIATAEKGPLETARRLATHDAQHPPLYYILCRLMLYVIPDTVLATRLVAAIAGILLIPATYYLSQQLFSSSLAAMLSAAIVAVSPFQYLYAQEARQYSLWTLCVVVSSIAYLSAIRKKSRLSWCIYACALFTSLCTSLLSLLLIVSHGLHLLWYAAFFSPSPVQRRHHNAHRLPIVQPSIQSKPVERRFLLAHFAASASISLLMFVPWLRRISATHISRTSWTARLLPFDTMTERWANNFTRLFFDFNLQDSAKHGAALSYQTLPKVAVISLLTYVLIWSAGRMSVSAKVFLLSLGGVTLATFVVPDLLFGGLRSTVARYSIPAYLSMQIACAYCLSSQLISKRFGAWWKAITAIILVAGILSCTISLPTNRWWNKFNSNANVAIARTLNQSPHSLLISSDYNINLGELLSISHLLTTEQSFLLFQEDKAPDIAAHLPAQFSAYPGKTFVFNLSAPLKAQLAASSSHQLTPTSSADTLWELTTTK